LWIKVRKLIVFWFFCLVHCKPFPQQYFSHIGGKFSNHRSWRVTPVTFLPSSVLNYQSISRGSNPRQLRMFLDLTGTSGRYACVHSKILTKPWVKKKYLSIYLLWKQHEKCVPRHWQINDKMTYIIVFIAKWQLLHVMLNIY
jgi:hypothetical protein